MKVQLSGARFTIGSDVQTATEILLNRQILYPDRLNKLVLHSDVSLNRFGDNVEKCSAIMLLNFFAYW